jgi:hypothetical protein
MDIFGFDVSESITVLVSAYVAGFGLGCILLLVRHVTHHIYEKINIQNFR